MFFTKIVVGMTTSVGENDDPFSETRTTSPSKAHHRHQQQHRRQHPHPHPDRQSVEETPHSALKFLSSLPSLDASAATTAQPPPQLATPRSQLLRDISNLSSHSVEAVEADTSTESVWPAKQYVSNSEFFKRLSSQKHPVDNTLPHRSAIASTPVSTSIPDEDVSLSLSLSFADSDLFAQAEPPVFASPSFLAPSHPHSLSHFAEENSQGAEKQTVSPFSEIPKAPFSFNPHTQQKNQPVKQPSPLASFSSVPAFSFQSANSNLSASPSPFDPSPSAAFTFSASTNPSLFSSMRPTESTTTTLPTTEPVFQFQASLPSTAQISKIPLPKTKAPAPRFKLDLGPDGGFTPRKPVLIVASLPGPSRLSALAGRTSQDEENEGDVSENVDLDAAVDGVLDLSATPYEREDLFLVDVPSVTHSLREDEPVVKSAEEEAGYPTDMPTALRELSRSAEMSPGSTLSFLVSAAPAAESGAGVHRYETIDADLTAPRLDLSFARAGRAGEAAVGMQDGAFIVKGSFDLEVGDENGQREEEEEDIMLYQGQMSVSEILVGGDVDELGADEEGGNVDGFSVEIVSAAAGNSGKKAGSQQQQQRHGSEAVVRGSLGPKVAGKPAKGKESNNNDSEDEDDRKRRGNGHTDSDNTGHRAIVPLPHGQQLQHPDASVEREALLFEDKLARDARLSGLHRLMKAVQDGTGTGGVLVPVGTETLEEVQDRLLFEFRLGISKIRGNIEHDRLDEQSYHDRIAAKKKELEKLEIDVAKVNKTFVNIQQDLTKAQNELVHELATLQQSQFENRKLIELAKTEKLLKQDAIQQAPTSSHKEIALSWLKYLGVVVRWIAKWTFKWILRVMTTLASLYLLYCWVVWMVTPSRDLQYTVYRKSRLSGPSLDMTVFRILDVLYEFLFGFALDAEGTGALL